MNRPLLPRFRATVSAATAAVAIFGFTSVASAEDPVNKPASPASESSATGSDPAKNLSFFTGGQIVEYPGTRPSVTEATIELNKSIEGPHQDAEYQQVVKNENVIPVVAHSDAMGVDVPLLVLRPKDASKRDKAPTLYALNGLHAGAGWFANTDAIKFYGERNVNVVMPLTGSASYYTDWRQGEGTKSEFSKQQWETFLTRELPGPLEKALNASGKRAIMGVSMSATSVLLAAQHNPGVYDAVGSFSGCASTTGLLGRKVVSTVLQRREDGASVNDMWGDRNSQYAKYNDPYLNARKLSPAYQGKKMGLFISSASGLAGRDDLTLTNPIAPGNRDFAAGVVIDGGPIDIGANLCTHALNNRLRLQGIPVTTKFYSTGTHQWGVFRRSVADSWPTFQKALF